MIVATVLRSGGDYDRRYAERLRAGVARHLPVPHRFVCLTDCVPFLPDGEPWAVPMWHRWPRWWPKIEALARPGLFPDPDELVMLLDLDTVIWDDLSPFAAYPGDFAILADVLRPKKMIGSGMVLFRPRAPVLHRIWEEFNQDPKGIMSKHRVRMDYWLRRHVDGEARIQDLWPGTVRSYKAHRRGRGRTLDGVRVICFHGRPRPHEVPRDDPVRRVWDG